MICEYCGKEYFKQGSKYCSRECCQEAYKKRMRDNYVGKREKVCRQCGKPLPKFKTKFCSIECNRRYRWIQIGKCKDHGELTKTCVVCGKEFKTWRSFQVTCSPHCSELSHHRCRNYRSRGIEVDADINLPRLAKRDKNICAICGKEVDWNDIYETEDGRKICLGNYPSIDHILPISLGGLHAWDNVQLAHMRCNSLKGNRYIG